MLFNISWEEFSLFLKIERGYSQKQRAVDANRSRFKQISRWFEGKEWSRLNIRLFLSELEERGLSRETLNKFISFFKNIDSFLDTGEAKKFKSKSVPLKRVDKVFSPSEIRAIAEYEYPYPKYKNFMNVRQKALLMVMGCIGCRIGELLELTWENVKEAPRKHLLFVDTKNGDDREVPINDELWGLIHAVPRKGDFVFYSTRNKSLRSGEINTDIKKRAKALGLNFRVYNHLFRHSYPTIMKKMRVADSDICKIAGWKKMDLLLRYDTSALDSKAEKMALHPLMQESMETIDKVKRLVDEAQLWFDPSTHKITPTIKEGKVVLEISDLS